MVAINTVDFMLACLQFPLRKVTFVTFVTSVIRTEINTVIKAKVEHIAGENEFVIFWGNL